MAHLPSQAEPGRERARVFSCSPGRCDRQDRLADHRMVAGLLGRDPERFLEVSHPAGVVTGHHLAACQVDVVMAAPH